MEEPWQAISRPSTSSQRCYHLHLADRPTWLPGRHGGQLQKLHWLHEYDERWPAQPVPFSSFFHWSFEVCFNIVTKIVEIHTSNIEKERNLPFSSILPSIGKILLNYLHQKLDRPTSQHVHLIWWLQKLLRWELLVEHPPAQEVYDSVVHPMLQQCHHLWWQ